MNTDLEYINKTYGLDAKIGGRVEYTGGGKPKQLGTIKGADGAHLVIQLDGDPAHGLFHPTWELKILSEVEVQAPAALDKNGIAILEGQKVRLAQTRGDYDNHDREFSVLRNGVDDELYLVVPLSEFQNERNGVYHSVEIL